MENQNNIQNELRNLNSGLPVDDSRNPFSVPNGYFDGLAASVLAKVKAQEASAAAELPELSPLLAGLSKIPPYFVPDGYFAQNIEALSVVTRDEEVSPLLASISKKMPYAVPQAYFDHLPQQVMATLAPKAKVVPLFARGWMRAAAAAVVGGLLFLGGYSYFNSSTDDRSASMQPADTSRTQVARADNKTVQDLKTISTKELDEFMKTVPANPAGKPRETTRSTEVNTLLKGVSAKEIDAFLEQLPASEEDLALID